jgi:hypothetical protein
MAFLGLSQAVFGWFDGFRVSQNGGARSHGQGINGQVLRARCRPRRNPL